MHSNYVIAINKPDAKNFSFNNRSFDQPEQLRQ